MTKTAVDTEITNDVVDIEDDKGDTEESVPLNRYDISFYGADYPVDGIVKRLKEEDIQIPRIGDKFKDSDEEYDGFQRLDNIWTKKQKDKFIESLLMGLPVPGIFLTKTKEGYFLVLDGQQRLVALQSFYDIDKKNTLGKSVQEEYRGKSYNSLSGEERRRLDNTIIHATVIRQEQPKGYSSIYHIFERLNSGGKLLTPQQIRMALYHGKLADLLLRLNQNDSWQTLLHKKETDSSLKDIELILRFFALFYEREDYKNPMKDFLNKFMDKNKNIEDSMQKDYKNLFVRTVNFIQKSIGDNAFCDKGSNTPKAAIVDSLMYGVAKRLNGSKRKIDSQKVKEIFDDVLKDIEYQDAINKYTSQQKQVEKRLHLLENKLNSI